MTPFARLAALSLAALLASGLFAIGCSKPPSPAKQPAVGVAKTPEPPAAAVPETKPAPAQADDSEDMPF